METFNKFLKNFFYKKQARGKYCHIDVYKKEDSECLFCYLDDYTDIESRFDEVGIFRKHIKKSTFEVIFLFLPKQGKLRVKVKGGKKYYQPLQVLFAKYFLDQMIPLEGRIDERIYNLNVLKNGNYPMPLNPDDNIENVNIKQLRFNSISNKDVKVTVESTDSESLYTLVSKLNIKLKRYKVTQARFKFKFPGKGNRGSHTFTVTAPNRSDLGDSKREKVIEKYLKEWKIDISK